MARMLDGKCRICRREGLKLYLKGTRCDTPKCAITRRDYPPGKRTWRRGKPSDYSLQLREKQKVKRYYGVGERQFRSVFTRAARSKGNTGLMLLSLLERRLDNVLYLAGLTTSRTTARQMTTHGFVLVNGLRATSPGQVLDSDDVVTLAVREKMQKMVQEALELTKGRTRPAWIQVTEQPPSVKVLGEPAREDISVPTQEQLIVELLSK